MNTERIKAALDYLASHEVDSAFKTAFGYERGFPSTAYAREMVACEIIGAFEELIARVAKLESNSSAAFFDALKASQPE